MAELYQTMTKFSRMKTVRFGLLITWSITTVLLLVSVFLFNRVAIDGQVLSELEVQANQLRLENILLENRIASEASLLVIDQKARNMGFTQSRIEYITKYERR